jgi:hypothetical protein
MKTLKELQLIQEAKAEVSSKTAAEVLEFAINNYAQSKFSSYMGGDNWPRGSFNVDKILEMITGKSIKQIEKMAEARYKKVSDEYYADYNKRHPDNVK